MRFRPTSLLILSFLSLILLHSTTTTTTTTTASPLPPNLLEDSSDSTSHLNIRGLAFWKSSQNPRIQKTSWYMGGKAKMRPENYKVTKNFAKNPSEVAVVGKVAKGVVNKAKQVKACFGGGGCGIPQPWEVGRRAVEEEEEEMQ